MATTQETKDFWKLMCRTPVGKEFRLVDHVTELDKKYQIFEVLVVDVLRRWGGDVEWAITPVQGDGGVDFSGVRSSVDLSWLLGGLKLDWKVVGQIKRIRDPHRANLLDAIGGLVQEIGREEKKGCRVTGMMLVISSEYRERVEELLSQDVMRRLYDGPRWYVPAERFLECFAAERQRIARITRVCFKPEEHETIRRFLAKYEPRFDPRIAATVENAEQRGQTGKLFRRTIVLQSTAPLPLTQFRLRYLPPKRDRNRIDVMRPSRLTEHAGVSVTIEGPEKYHFDVWLRSYVPGLRRLGALEVLDKDGRLCSTIALGTVDLRPLLEPPYFAAPTLVLQSEARRQIGGAAAGSVEVLTVVGAGGSGKTRFCQRLVDLAADDHFQWCASGQQNSPTAGRELFGALLAWLSSCDATKPESNDDIARAIAQRLRTVSPEIIGSVRNYLSGASGVEQDHIAAVLLALIAERTRGAPLILHLFDLHWMGGEGFGVLRLLLEYLRRNESKLQHGVMILLEGRERESLAMSDATFRFPEDWFLFLKTSGHPLIRMNRWSTGDSEAFLHEVIRAPMDVHRRIKVASVPLHDELIAYVQKHSTGNPMHLVEQLKRLHDHRILRQHDNGLLFVRRALPRQFKTPEKIEELIRARIDFYERSTRKAVDLLTVLARTGRRAQGDLFTALARAARLGDQGRQTLAQMDVASIPQTSAAPFEFAHENYYQVFRDRALDEKSTVLAAAIRWYEAQETLPPQQLAELVRLLDSAGNPKPKKTLQLVSIGMNASREAEDDLLLEEFLRRYLAFGASLQRNAGLDDIDARYELAEVLTRVGSWNDASNELREIVAATESGPTPYRTFQWVRANAELSNVYLAAQDADRAIAVAQDGLRRIGAVPSSYDPERLREKLLHRIAVAMWFDGRAVAAARWQWESYKVNGRRGDPYDRTTILREIGTILFHRHPRLGARVLQRALDLARSLPKFPHEPLFIIEAQQTMGKLLAAVQHREGNEVVKRICGEAAAIYARCLKQYTRYEATLAALVAGAASAYLRELAAAHEWFRNAAELATQACLGDEIWKSRLNLAQVGFEMGEREEARLNAREALDGILDGLRKGESTNRLARRALMALPLAHVARILDASALQDGIREGVIDAEATRFSNWKRRPPSQGRGPQQVLHVRRGDNDYFLMN